MELDLRAQQVQGLISGIVYHSTVKTTEGAEHRGHYHGNGHHWAQEIAKGIAGKVVSRYLEVFPFWLAGQHRREVWRLVSSIVTPSVHRRARSGSFIHRNCALWIVLLIDHITNYIFTRSKDIEKAIGNLLDVLAASDPFRDPTSTGNPAEAMKNFDCPAN